MNQVKAFFGKYWHTILAVAVVALIIYLVYRAGKKSGTGNVTVTDDQGNIISPSNSQQAQANEIATRIHSDLTSGFLFGYNIWGTLGRDADAYTQFAGMSDSMFSFTAQTYRTMFGSSIIADIRNEGSLPDDTFPSPTPKHLILEKASRLNIS